MADLPFSLADSTLEARLLGIVDAEGKIPKALAVLGPLEDRDLVLVDGGGGYRACQLGSLGARVTVLESSLAPRSVSDAAEQEVGDASRRVVGDAIDTGLPAESADVVVSCWSAFRGPSSAEVAEANRVLRPGGRLLVVHDYGRDDVSPLRGARDVEVVAWSRRDGWFLQNGFRVRVIHCWWRFATIEEAREFLCLAFGASGEEVASRLRGPRLSYNIAVYHRTKAESAGAPVRR